MRPAPAPGERTALLLASTGHALCHASKVALPVVTVSAAAAEFGVGLEEMGLALSAFTAAMAAASLPAGLAGDRWGTGKVLAAFFWLTALAAVGCALAKDFATFLVAHTALGAAAGLLHPAGLGLLSLTIEGGRLGPALGRFGVAGSLGIAATPLLVNSAVGWRPGFLALSALGFAGALACQLLAAVGKMPHGRPPQRTPQNTRASRHLPRTELLCLLAAMSVNAFLLDGFLPLFPEHVVAGGNLDWDQGTLLAGVLAVGGLGQWVGGHLAGERAASRRYALLLLAQPFVLLLLAQGAGARGWPLLWMGLFTGLNFMTQPIENRLLAAYTSAARRATAYALKFVVALAVAIPAPGLMTKLYEEGWAFADLYRLLALCGTLGVAAIVLFLRGPRRAAPLAGAPPG